MAWLSLEREEDGVEGSSRRSFRADIEGKGYPSTCLPTLELLLDKG